MGKIVVIEGTDFSGKSTQYDLLLKRLQEQGYDIGSDSFPNYDSPSSFFVKSYLRGVFGENPNDIDPKIASTFYAMDRYASYKMKEWSKMYKENGNILFARYITSNILHQASKYSSWKEKKEFIDWLYSFEVGLLGLPKEDCTILLDMPIEMGQKLKKERLKQQNGLTSSGSEVDIHENDITYLKHSYDTALQVCDYLGWYKVSCVNSFGQLKGIQSINDEIFNIVSKVFIK